MGFIKTFLKPMHYIEICGIPILIPKVGSRKRINLPVPIESSM
jgi:hypothetical protein